MEVLSQARLPDMSLIPQVQFQEVHAVVSLIAAVVKRGLGVGVALEVVYVLQAGGQVAPSDVYHLVYGRAVMAGEEGQE